MRGSGRAPAIQLSFIKQSDTCKRFHRITCVDTNSKTFRGGWGIKKRRVTFKFSVTMKHFGGNNLSYWKVDKEKQHSLEFK